ncbi:hypothetical protein AGIG_G9043 [Arapaima gigas]
MEGSVSDWDRRGRSRDDTFFCSDICYKNSTTRYNERSAQHQGQLPVTHCHSTGSCSDLTHLCHVAWCACTHTGARTCAEKWAMSARSPGPLSSSCLF